MKDLKLNPREAKLYGNYCCGAKTSISNPGQNKSQLFLLH